MAESIVEIWQRLQARYPWPEQRPACEAVDWSLDFGGRQLVVDLIQQRPLKVVLEVGVFLGGSVRQWLSVSPDVVVVAVDLWPAVTEDIYNYPQGREHAGQLMKPDGLYEAFLASLWDQRDRVIPVRGDAMSKLHELHALGLRPDLIYLDTDKTGHEIPLLDELFPQAIITGDDWYWVGEGKFPIRAAVRESTRRKRRHLKHSAMTWVIDDRPKTLAERFLWLRNFRQELGLWMYGVSYRLLKRKSNHVTEHG